MSMNVLAHKYYAQSILPLSYSSRGTLHSCERRFELRKLYGHDRSEREESLPPEVGHALHTGYQTYFATRDRDAAAAAFMLRYPAHLCNNRNDQRSIEAAYLTLEEMMAHPIDSRYKIATINHNGVMKPAIEVPFRIMIRDVSLLRDQQIAICYDGFIDLILLDTVTGDYCPLDIKTTRTWRTDYSAKYMYDDQCLPYGYILQRVLNRNTTAFNVLYLVAFIDALKPRVFMYDFPITEQRVQEWAFTFAFELNMLRQYAEMGFFPRRGASCDGYGVCQYFDVCGYTNPDDIRKFLDSQFGPRSYDTDTVSENFDPWFTINLTIEGLV